MLKTNQINEIHRLAVGEHWSIRRVARQLHMDTRTVQKYLHSPVPLPVPRPRPSKLDPFKPLLAELLAKGPRAPGSVILQRLQAAGYVERTRNPADERQVFVELTDQSKALEERAACMGVAVFGEAGISIERLFRLRDEVNTLRDALNAKLAAKRR